MVRSTELLDSSCLLLFDNFLGCLVSASPDSQLTSIGNVYWEWYLELLNSKSVKVNSCVVWSFFNFLAYSWKYSNVESPFFHTLFASILSYFFKSLFLQCVPFSIFFSCLKESTSSLSLHLNKLCKTSFYFSL